MLKMFQEKGNKKYFEKMYLKKLPTTPSTHR